MRRTMEVCILDRAPARGSGERASVAAAGALSPTAEMNFVTRIFQEYVLDLRESADRESAELKLGPEGKNVLRRLFIVVIGATLCLVFVRFAGDEQHVAWACDLLNAVHAHRAARGLAYAIHESPDARIWQRVWWACGRVAGYGVLPFLLVKLALGDSLAKFGVRWKGTASNVRTYALLLAILVPVIFLASFGQGFQMKYPYYKVMPGEHLWPGFVLWEFLYAAQFVSLEFFFRGVIVHGLRDAMGYAAVLVPIMPYCMIHFGKPLPEALASIIAGLVLGTLSLKTRSIWGGAVLHVSAATSMDLFALWHAHLL